SQPLQQQSIQRNTLLFFFSSRRRHTRFSRDWSSDVCSSDLKVSALSIEKIRSCMSIFGCKPTKNALYSRGENGKLPLRLVPQVIQLLDRIHQLRHFMETVPILAVQRTIDL